jgi:hypothetical protein
MRDFQRSRVYQWEFTWRPFSPRLSLEECQEFVDHVYKKLHRPNPPRVFRRGKTHAHANNKEISLPDWARCKSVIVHELAHSIACQDRKGDGHGPVFMRYYLNLSARFLKMNKSELYQSAKKAGIKIAIERSVKVSR